MRSTVSTQKLSRAALAPLAHAVRTAGRVVSVADLSDDECEEIARRASRESTLDERDRVDPRLLAVGYLRLRLRPRRGAHARLQRDVIVYDPDEPPDARSYRIAHECGHWLLRDEGWTLDRATEERAASRIAAALLLPRRAYLRDLGRTGWDLDALHELWPLASRWIHARRITEVAEGAVASRWTRRTCRDRVVTTDTVAPVGVTPIEKSLASAALAGRVAQAGPRLRSWPEAAGAIVLCSVDALRAEALRTKESPRAGRSLIGVARTK